MSQPNEPVQPPSENGRDHRPGKILVIGLDGATFDLIKPWANEGNLPTLKRLLQQGAHGPLGQHHSPHDGPGLDLVCYRR